MQCPCGGITYETEEQLTEDEQLEYPNGLYLLVNSCESCGRVDAKVVTKAEDASRLAYTQYEDLD